MTPYFASGGGAIYHGDCREILPSLPSVDLVLTDPPYAASGARSEWKTTASVAIGLHEAAKRVRKGGAMLAFTTTSGRGMDFTREAVGSALSFNRLLVWHKSSVRSRVAGPWRWDAVAIMAFGRACWGRAERSSVIQTATSVADGNEHPAELPPGVAEWLYEPFDRPDLIVLDPFMGVGTLLFPAARAGRRVIGIEQEERYCEMAAQRLKAIEERNACGARNDDAGI